MIRRLTPFALLLVAIPLAPAQERISGANYPLAQKFTREFVAQHVQEANVLPQWIGKTDQFIYAARTPTGTRYWKVDPAKKERVALFDHVALAAKLSEASKKPLDGDTLRLGNTNMSEDGKKLTFVYADFRYEYTLEKGELKQLGKAPQGGGGFGGQMSAEQIERMRQQLGEERMNEILRQQRDRERGDRQDQQQDQQQQQQQQDNQNQQQQNQNQQQQGTGTGQTPQVGGPPQLGYKNISPDKKKYVFAQKHNLYLGEEGQPDDKAVQITKDGAESYSFAGFGGGGFGRRGGGTGTGTTGTTDTAAQQQQADRKTRPNVTWSPDSKAFYVTRTDSRGVKDLWLVNSIATPRPALEQYPYPMPGEDTVRKPELYLCNADKKEFTRVTPKWKDERYYDVRWGKTGSELRFIRRDRLQRNLEICKLDAATGKSECLFAEGFEAANLGVQQGNPRYVEDTDDMIWWSERSGWGHYYRYGRDGKLKNALTSGNWRASRIVEVDGKNGLVYLLGNGREAGENPYYVHLYRVKLDGTDLTCLDPSVPCNAASGLAAGGFNQSSSLSPTKKFVVTNSTAIDAAPFATVRDDKGQVVMTLETTDLSRLKATGWQMPETFSVKAADGVTDLYGNMWKPFDFDAKKKYPIIAYVYPGPQTEGVNYRFGAHSTYMQLAQLGFVVIQVGHRGGSPERSKAYHSFGYFNLRDYGLVDKKAAIEALAARHSFIDVGRVGIYGHSGGGFMSAAALLQKPYNEFFKVAVASAGNHDNNIYNDNWSEQYHGMKEVAVTDEKKDGTSTTTGTGTGTGFGNRRRGGGGGPTDEEYADLADLEAVITELELFDPDQRDLDDLRKKADEMKKKIAALEKEAADAKTTTTTGGTNPDKADVGKAVTEAAKTVAKMKFEIKVPTNAELADNLKGHLMLVHGEIDNNVHPANTMRLVDALIKANKRFDLLLIPGARHGFGAANPYFTQRMWDHFAEHLLGDRQTGADINSKDVKRK